MWNVSGRFHDIRQMASVMLQLGADGWRFLVLCLRPAPTLAAEILFLRKQLALFEERHIKSRRVINAARLVMVWLSHWFDWRPVLRIVKPETLQGAADAPPSHTNPSERAVVWFPEWNTAA